MELRQLKYFITVAEELHFGKAAKRLNISQPPLSQSIAQLEKEMGVQLFLRTKRIVQLTPAGEFFLKQSYRILHDLEKAVRDTVNIELGETGILEIGYTGSLSSKIIKIINNYKVSYPEAKVILNRMSSSEQLKALKEKRIHLGFLCPPIDPTFLDTLHIHGAPFVVALPSSHKLAKEPSPLDLKDLANEDFIMSPRSHEPGYYDTIISIFNKAGISPKIHQEAEGITTILTLVSAGIGVSLVSKFAMENIRKEVTLKEFQGYNTEIDLYLASRKDNELQIVNNFIHVTRKFLVETSSEHEFTS